MVEKPARRWFRFSLRTIFLLVTLLCCWLGWESSIVHRRRAVLREFGAGHGYQFNTASDYVKRYPPNAKNLSVAQVSFVRRLLGDEAIQEIWYSHTRSETDLKRLAEAFPEATIQEIPLEPCHPGCFPRGTLVDTPQGPRRIETIQIGEPLTAFLPSGQQIVARVQSIFVTQNRLWKIETSGGTLLTTEAQPLCVAFNRAIPAGELQPGDFVLFRAGMGQIPVEVVAAKPTGRTERVFNLVLGDSEVFVAGGFLARSKPPR
jgi:hypothetical protein